MKGLTEFLRGPGGGYELTRGLGALGGIAYVIGAHAFVGVELGMGRGFDLIAYCTAFPAGLAAILAAVAGGASWKDKGTASAEVIKQTGAVPAPPPAGPRVPRGPAPPVDDRQPAPGEYGETR